MVYAGCIYIIKKNFSWIGKTKITEDCPKGIINTVPLHIKVALKHRSLVVENSVSKGGKSYWAFPSTQSTLWARPF